MIIVDPFIFPLSELILGEYFGLKWFLGIRKEILLILNKLLLTVINVLKYCHYIDRVTLGKSCDKKQSITLHLFYYYWPKEAKS